MKNSVDQLINDKKNPICQRCKEEIKYPGYVIIGCDIITNSKKATQLYTCPEQAFNFNQKIIMHDYCWMRTLREHGTPLYDIDKLAEEHLKKEGDKNV